MKILGRISWIFIALGPPQVPAVSQNEKGEGAEDSEKVEKESKDKDKSRVLVFDMWGNKQS